jgi:3-oxoadipate enol-lactonase/4-carboxymuconolactone decarboxylase
MKTHYKLEGTPNSPVLVFSNSLGANYHMWDELVPLLLPYFRVLRYDTRGHGHSSVTPGEYSIELLGQDVIDLVDSLGIETFAFCGLSMGGLIGQWLGIHHSKRLKHLILCHTAAKIGNADRWNERIDRIQRDGTEGMAAETMDRWFTSAFQSDQPDKIAFMEQIFAKSPNAGYISCCAAIRDADFQSQLGEIQAKTLVITGDEDPVTNVEQAEFLVQHIPNCQLNVLPARHLSATEHPADFAELLLQFMVGTSVQDRGMHVRRTVLGDAHVDRSIQHINEMNADFQSFITEYAWGEIWTRPALDKPTRSFITLALLIALNRKDEFKMHVRAALHNGLTATEIKELIMHSALYCGLPAANEAIHAAEEIIQST